MLVANSLKRVSARSFALSTRKNESWLAFRNVNAHRRKYATATEIQRVEEELPSHASSSARISGYNSDSAMQYTTTSKGKAIMQLINKSRTASFAECLRIATQMKHAGIQPDLITYNALMEAAARGTALRMDSWAILEDLLASGLLPDIRSMNSLLKAQLKELSPYFWRVLQLMNEMKIAPNTSTFSLIAYYSLQAGNIEMALQWLYSSAEYGFVPDFGITQAVVMAFARRGYPRLAIDLITWYEELSLRRVDGQVWMACLIGSAESFYGEGTSKAWDMAITTHKQVPGEGLCEVVLNTAARCGLPDLAAEVLEVLHSNGFEILEHHAAALVEAFVTRGELRHAIDALSIVESLGAKLRPETSFIFADYLKTVEDIDSCWSIVDDLQATQKVVHPAVVTGLIKASVKLGDLQRAMGLYKALSDYRITPDVTIFNLLLQGCIAVRHRKLGNTLLDDMTKAAIPRDITTYQLFISLCLTQEEYQDAFWYLEEMKAAGYKPPYKVYEELITTLIRREDSRLQVALKEMNEQKYSASSRLAKLILHATKVKGRRSPNKELNTIDDEALQFMESGGLEGRAELPSERSS